MGYIEQVSKAELHAIFGPYAYSEKIAGVTAFSHTQEQTVTRHGANNFGGTGPVAVTHNYQGESGSITIEGTQGDSILAALVSGVDPATFVVDNPKNRFPLYFVSNSYDEDGATPIAGHIVIYAKIENTPRPVGPDARSYNFQAKSSKVFHGKKIAIDAFPGNATPVTSLVLTDAAFEDPDDSTYAQLVLRQTTGTKTVTVLTKGTDYTETASTITLTTGLTATEKAIVVYAKA